MINLDDYEEIEELTWDGGGVVKLPPDVVVLRKKKSKSWTPREWQVIWYIRDDGAIATAQYDPRKHKEYNNVFPTKEQAAWALPYMREHNRLLRAIAQVECFEPDWDDPRQKKYTFYYHNNKWDWFVKYSSQYAAGPAVSTMENAEKVVELLNN